MATPLELKVVGLTRVEALLDRAALKALNLAPVLGGPISKSINQFYARMFTSRGEVGGERWAPLRPFTLALKARHNRANMGTLRFTNRLWSSLTKRGGVGSVRIVTPHYLEQGTTLPEARWAQLGFTSRTIFGRPRTHPRRVEPRRLAPRELPSALVLAWTTLIAKYVEP